MSEVKDKRLLRPHTSFNLMLRTTLAKQLYGVSMRMVNSLTELSFKAKSTLPPDRAKQVMAASFEVIEGVRHHLEIEVADLQGRQIQTVTIFPVKFQKSVRLVLPNGVAVLQMLVDLDKLTQQWHDLWFLGEMTTDEFEEKQQQWRKRFRKASGHICSLNSCKG